MPPNWIGKHDRHDNVHGFHTIVVLICFLVYVVIICCSPETLCVFCFECLPERRELFDASAGKTFRMRYALSLECFELFTPYFWLFLIDRLALRQRFCWMNARWPECRSSKGVFLAVGYLFCHLCSLINDFRAKIDQKRQNNSERCSWHSDCICHMTKY